MPFKTSDSNVDRVELLGLIKYGDLLLSIE